MAINKYSDGNAVVAAVMDKRFGRMLGERTSITSYPAFQRGYLGNLQGQQSGKISKTLADIGLGVMTATDEDTAVTPKAFSFEEVSATVAIQREAFRTSQLLEVLSAEGLIRDPIKMTEHALGLYHNTILNLVCTQGATFTTDFKAGADGKSPLDWTTLRKAASYLTGNGANVEDGVVAIISQKGWGDLQDTMVVGAGLSDAYVDEAARAGAFRLKNLGYQGNFFGIDIFVSGRVPMALANEAHRGCMFTAGGIVWADASIYPDPDAHEILLQDGKLQIEFHRDPAKWSKEVYFNAPLGVNKGIDKAGCTITYGA